MKYLDKSNKIHTVSIYRKLQNINERNPRALINGDFPYLWIRKLNIVKTSLF